MNIKKFLRGNPRPIIEKSLINVHTTGLYSLVFSENPMVRLYFADTDHDLWKNEPFVGLLSDNVFFHELSIAVHPHHSALTIYPIFGSVYNIGFVRTNRGYAYSTKMSEYVFTSPIGNEPKHYDRGFTYVGEKIIYYDGEQMLYRSLKMRASDLHTVYVPRSENAAWLIVEGKEDPKYTGECFSNRDLTQWAPDGLYRPMTEQVAQGILDTCRKNVGL